MNNVSIQQQFKYLVSNVETKLLAQLQVFNPKICCVNYQYGRLTEIIQTLQIWSQNQIRQYKLFPLIALAEDFTVINNNSPYASCRLNILIAYPTDINYQSADRQTNTFLPILNPLYDELIDQIYKCGYFSIYNPLKEMIHEKIEHGNWAPNGLYNITGGKTANVINEYVDCIEIKNLTLKIENVYCKPN
jgi:hypothetical protein